MPIHRENNLPLIHRYITTHNPDGEAVFVSHARVPDYMPSKPAGEDGEIALLYATTTMPTNVEDEVDIAMYDEFLHRPPGLTTENGATFRMVDLRPGKVTPMHRTVSVDYGIVLDGEVDLILDSGESRVLYRGDVCVQRGTAHSFRNKSATDWCRLLFVFLPMQMLTINGRDLDTEIYDDPYSKSDEGENN
ncbi:Cupin 2 conserved barrel [Penicillium sp. IBT 18751x]|nr:Cupin 2 conserved barrel [Penicillium sp. IBT 18751x]